MKKLTLTTSLILVLTFSLANCQKHEVGGDQGTGMILAQMFGNIGKGNCAISINNVAMAHGLTVMFAVTDGKVSGFNSALSAADAAYAGVWAALYTTLGPSGNLAQAGDRFGQNQFEDVMGMTVNQLGYNTWATVPYTVKYEAFFKEGRSGYWSAGRRERLLVAAKQFLDITKPMAFFNYYTTLSVGQAWAQGTASFGQLSSAQQTALNTLINTISSGAIASFSVYQATFLASQSGVSAITSALGAIGAVMQIGGTGTLICIRAPKASCTFAGLATNNRDDDIKAQSKRFDLVSNNPSCAKPSGNFLNALTHAMFMGLPRMDGVANMFTTRGSYTLTHNNANSENPLLGFTAKTKILSNNAYPKVGTFVTSGFGLIMPVREGSDPYPITTGASTATTNPAGSKVIYTGGSNMNVTAVDTCESIGLPNNNAAVATYTMTGTKNGLPLSPVSEVVYSFSDNGAAASAYEDMAANWPASGVTAYSTTTQTPVGNQSGTIYDVTFTAPNYDQMVACNTSFRKATSVPTIVGPQLDTSIRGTSGNGRTTSDLSVCTYGGDSANNIAQLSAKGILGAGFVTTIYPCSSTAKDVSHLFGTDINSLPNYPFR